MKPRFPQTRFAIRFILVALVGASTLPAADPAGARPTKDAHGNPLRYAATGHVSNYDEARVGNYTLPDPLVLQSGERVRDAATWRQRRRPELIRVYEQEIWGRVPATAPSASFAVVATDPAALEGTAVRQHIVGRFRGAAGEVAVNVILFRPAHATGPVPVLVHLLFGSPPGIAPPPAPPGKTSRPTTARNPFAETGPIATLLARGYGYATLRYTEIEGDRADTNLTGIRRLALKPGQDQPAPDEWGTVSAWAWGVSRLLDYLATDSAVDATRLGLIGHSRLGKTALWAGAQDERLGVIFSSCSGEMGAALARRDYGESVDDVAANFPWWLAGNFQKYSRRWNDLPVDAHTLIALSAPRRVFVTGGTGDQWADPKGEFLAQVAAGPVYRLLGRRDLGTDQLPPLDHALTAGDLGFLYHTGGHTITPADWAAFLLFAEPVLRPSRP